MSEPQYDYQHGYNEKNSIAIIWCIDDIKDKAKEMEVSVKLTDKQCMYILWEIHRRHDASLGVSWDTLEYAIENYINELKCDKCSKVGSFESDGKPALYGQEFDENIYCNDCIPEAWEKMLEGEDK